MSSEKKEPPLLTAEYFQLTKQYQDIYGKNTVVLLQNGTFFEIYGYKNMKTDVISGSPIEDVCNKLHFEIGEKKTIIGDEKVLIGGFNVYMLETYLPKIIEIGYTVVVYVQDENQPLDKKERKKRVLLGVYSTGTMVSYDTESSPQITNNIMCIWIKTYKPFYSINGKEKIVYGVSVANVFTGKSYLFEYENTFYMNPTTFDELERCISIYNPSELILLSPFDNNVINQIVQYSGIRSPIIHRRDTRDLSNQKIQNCEKQKYMSHILSTFFGYESMNVCSDFSSYTMATQSFCYLLDFIQEHNPNLIKKMTIPDFNNTSKKMVLANHTLKQLNIIDDNGKMYGNLSSVMGFLNKCCTAMGKRLFQQQMTSPTTDVEWLNTEYSMISLMLENYSFIENCRKILTKVRDIEKICRQLLLGKVYPSTVFQLHQSIEIISQVNKCLYENDKVCNYLCKDASIEKVCKGINEFLEKNLIIENCKNINSTTSFSENIIQSGISIQLDELLNRQKKNMDTFHTIYTYLNNLLKTNNNDSTEYIKKHKPEKSAVKLQITKTRANKLKTILKNVPDDKTIVNINGTLVDLKDIKFSMSSSNNDEISFGILNCITSDLQLIEGDINTEITRVYMDVLKNLEKSWFDELNILSEYVSKLDVLQSKTYVAKTYNYCRPEITENDKNSFVDAKQLRHCLIEHIQTNEIYVPNDISIGDDKQTGILLYGTNAVGKTSLIRALGISVIMAQCGMFVPCSEFVYSPYTAIYSRILGNDNLFKGMSTFAVEISELRVILNKADNRSLVLGDEICSGTETESALSIFVKSLMRLHDKDVNFIFATHFHEILKYEEVKDLKKMALMYMAVEYDPVQDCLLYDRKLKYGSGNRMYGLEVCKSLYLDEEFLTGAYELRNKYFPENRGELSNKACVYNSKKIRGICEMCKEKISSETHHILEQKEANEDGFIGTVHKNHPANLMALCEKCHNKTHKTGLITIRKKKIDFNVKK